MNQGNEQWTDVLNLLKNRYSKPSFDTWLKPTTAKIEGNRWLIVATNEFARDWLVERYLPAIKEAIHQFTKEATDVEVIVEEDVTEAVQPDDRLKNIIKQIDLLTSSEREKLAFILNHSEVQETEAARVAPELSIDPNYTFENYSENTNNRFASAAAKSVATAPGKAYNPLYIHGGAGVGKTHILHAIGNEILEHDQHAKVIYVTGIQFIKDFIENIEQNQVRDFRSKYVNADVLLFDDISLLAGKNLTQEEFFHIFNHLYERSKQIVVTSSLSLKEISLDNERILARLQWGLTTEILSANHSEKSSIDFDNGQVSMLSTEDKINELKDNGEPDRITQIESELKQLKDHLNMLESKVNGLGNLEKEHT